MKAPRVIALISAAAFCLLSLSTVANGSVRTLHLLRADAARASTAANDPLAVYFRHDAVGRAQRALAMTQCGTERWPVKTGTDDDRHRVNATPRDVSLSYLRSRPTPSSRPQTARVAPVERTTYRVHARLIEFKREADDDYHLVLADRGGRTLVVEIPAPECVGRISPFRAGIRAARHAMDSRFTVGSEFQQSSVAVVVRGIGFFDYLHGQTGMAPNGVELHPVIGIRFG